MSVLASTCASFQWMSDFELILELWYAANLL